jgi:rRNA maturation endonuclease Nob1
VTAEELFYVVDTSALIAIEDNGQQINQADGRKVYARLTELASQGSAVYPKQVVTELERYSAPDSKDTDAPYQWAKANEEQASRVVGYDEVKKVFEEHPQIERVVDHKKTSGVEDADPYVIALALRLQREGKRVVVLTNDYIDHPTGKLSVASACGLLNIVPLRLRPFAAQQGLLSTP